jgi:hypothetical protein
MAKIINGVDYRSTEFVNAKSLRDISDKAFAMERNKEFLYVMTNVLYACTEAANKGEYSTRWDKSLPNEVITELGKRMFVISKSDFDEFYYKISW